MNGNQFSTTLFCLFFNAGHCEVVDAHAVGQADTLVLDRRIIVVVVTTEESRRAAKLKGGIEHLALIVGADLLSSRFALLPESKMSVKTLFNYMFFGDGAGAVVLTATNGEGILYAEASSNNASEENGSIIEIGGSVYPYPTDEVKMDRWPIFQASGISDDALARVLVKTMKQLKEKGFDLNKIDKFIMPIASEKIMEKVLSEVTEIVPSKVYSCENEGGALINAALPLSLYKAFDEGLIQKGDRILIYAAENTKWQHAVLVAEI